MPDTPWIMTQSWHDLLFAHWPVDRRMLQEKVPAGLPIDLHDGQAWVGIVPFHITNLAPRGVPSIPFVSAFPELNVRTYVTLEDKPGVYFFSLDAGSVLAVEAARTLYHLPYMRARMRTARGADGVVTYLSHRTDARGKTADFRARYRAIGPVRPAAQGSLDHWLTERYCLYAVDSAGRIRRAVIHHHPWPLQSAEAQIEVNTMTDAAGVGIQGPPQRIAFSESIDVVVWRPQVVR